VDLGDRLQRWWDRVRGYEQATAKSLDQSSAAGPVGARPVGTVVGDGQDGTLKLSVESKPQPPGPAKSRVKEAGFDPYESTGGYRKPRGWDDVPRK
jgi:hypothetical protein